MDYRDEFKKQFPRIRPFMEDDLEWFNEGLELLNRGKLREAEKKFKRLVLSQPEHPDGLEGLARTYLKMGDRRAALFFVKEAIEMTRKMVAVGQSDREVLDMMEELRTQVEQAT